ncbi:hypothetical protein [Citrobacter portucalensis]|uniref:hypothetical protein n=1 Tax=Citrobacter portucalensis TaxID=1639133 RepID=UPI001F269D46|nr:hypothetical protein [Citrobacter portucalensis]
MSSRDKFEQAIKARFGDLIDYRACKNSDGEYMAWDMQVAWWAWQAAETDMAVQLANAESKCRELATECKTLSRFISGSCYVFDGDHDDDMPDEFIDASHYMPIVTPATDAFLAEVRAQGVDAAIEHLSKKFEGTGHIGVPVMALEWLAQELRKGAAL